MLLFLFQCCLDISVSFLALKKCIGGKSSTAVSIFLPPEGGVHYLETFVVH